MTNRAMPRNWKLLAEASGHLIPEEQLDRIAPVLESLESAFRPLSATLPFETEPAIILSEAALGPSTS